MTKLTIISQCARVKFYCFSREVTDMR
uniref:Uncharacterized protein n=1 Tax=Anguilla anguilla TaxID=7936 RepID=A0A0E9T681_ANGAN